MAVADRAAGMRVFDIGGGDGPEVVSDRILTVPNLLSLARLMILPVVYVDLALEPYAHLRALILVGVFAATDWLDGYVARRFGQVTKLGKLLDPISDRILLVVVGVGMVVADLVPLWAVLLVVVRDVLVMLGGLYLLRRGEPTPPVTKMGKAATFGLMWAFPAFILASVTGDGPQDPQAFWYAFAWFTYATNIVLYYLAAADYVRTVFPVLRADDR